MSMNRNIPGDGEDYYKHKFTLMVKYLNTIKNINDINEEQTLELKELFSNMIKFLLENQEILNSVNRNQNLKQLVNIYQQQGIINFSIDDCYKMITELYFSNKLNISTNKYMIDYILMDTSKTIFIPKDTKPLCFFAVLNRLLYIDLEEPAHINVDYPHEFLTNYQETLENIINSNKIGYFMKYFIFDVLYLYISHKNDNMMFDINDMNNVIEFYSQLNQTEKNRFNVYISLVPNNYFVKARDDLINYYLFFDELTQNQINEMFTAEKIKSYVIISYPLYYILNNEIENDVGNWSNRFSRNLV